MSETAKKAAKPKGGTLGQIAERAGCSIPTVSRVLNGYKTGFSVKPEVVARIQAAVEEFHYAPNPLLRSIRAKNSRVIAIFDPVSNSFGALRDAKSGFLLELAATEFFDVTKYVSLYHPASYRLPLVPAGALLFDVSEPGFLDFMEESRIPYVVINGICREHGCSLLFDEAENVRLVVAELRRLGHRRIAFYSNPVDTGQPTCHYSGPARREAFRREAAAAGCAPQPEELFTIGEAGEFFRRAVGEFGATAVVCSDHACTMELLLSGETFRRVRSRELSVVSLSDDFPLDCGETPIAAVSIDGAAVGRRAARLLRERIERSRSGIAEPEPPGKELLPGTLLPRRSLFPAVPPRDAGTEFQR